MKAAKYLLCLLTTAAGCAPALVAPPDTARERFPAEAAAEVSRILEMEDRRDLQATVFRPATQSPIPEVRRRALLALGRMGIRDARGLVEPRLWDPDTSVAASAVFAAGMLADTAATQRLGELATPRAAAEAPTVAVEAVRALATIRTPEAVDRVRELLLEADPGGDGSAAVAAGLTEMSRLGIPSTPWQRWIESAEPTVVAAALRSARHDPAPNLGRVEAMLEAPDSAVRAAAVALFNQQRIEAAGLGPEQAIRLLEPRLEDPDYATRVAAWRSIASLETPALSPRLVAHLSDGPAAERHAIIEGLALRRSLLPQALQTAVRRLVEDPSASGELRADAVDALREMLADQDLLQFAAADSWRVRAAAHAALLKRGAPGGTLRMALADHDPKVGAVVLEALVSTSSQADLRQHRSELWEAIHHNDTGIRAAAARGLGRVGDPATTPLLLDAFQNGLRDTDVIAALAAVDAIAELALRTGLPTQRAFAARFQRPDDHRIRQRVEARLGLPARWGDTWPLETSLGDEFYGSLVDDYLLQTDSLATSMTLIISGDTVRFALFPEEAPLHVSRLIQMAQLRFFDGLVWSSARPAGLLLTGDRSTRAGEGSGFSIRGERTRREAVAGSVGMVDGPQAIAGELFVVLGPEAVLPPEFTIVGQVEEGLDSLRSAVAGDRIERLVPGTTEME